MTSRPSDTAPLGRRTVIVGAVVFALLAAAAVGLLVLVLAVRTPGPGGTAAASATPTPDPKSFVYPEPRPAPALELIDQDGQPFSLTSQLGRPVLVFFGYTHCPDVCPVTVGVVGEVLAATGTGPRAIFTSIDPERDDVAAMHTYFRYLSKQFIGLSGTTTKVRENADRWGIQYAKIEQGSAGGYAMAHTADVFLVDAQGRLRAHFPFGTPSGPMIDAVKGLLAETPAPPDVAATSPSAAVGSPSPTFAVITPAPDASAPTASSSADPVASQAPGGVALLPEVISTSIWAGTDPVILRLVDAEGKKVDNTVPVDVQLTGFDGAPVGPPVTAVPLLPEGERQYYFVANLQIPAPGAYKLAITAGAAQGDITIQALDPGKSTPIGAQAPLVHTPTIDDVGGVVRAVTTQPNPDLRLSQRSTSDARDNRQPYVIVIDSARFKVSPACGRALTMVRYLLDRWPGTVFIHLEPFVYQIITEEPVLSGPLTDPPMNEWSTAYGLGDETWPGTAMPWIFVVDSNNVVRAKYTGIVGSADIDVILTLMKQEGTGG